MKSKIDINPRNLGALVVLITIFLDQLSKWWVVNLMMVPPKIIQVTSFFDLVLVYNRGVSFGIFNNSPDWVGVVLICFAILISIGLAFWIWQADGKLVSCALALVVGGAVGNVLDRIQFGAVVDFLDFHVWGWHWPAFNVADAAITIGVVMLILDSFKPKSKTL
jgi:signal peptidase II